LARGISPALKVGTGFELGQPPCVAGEVAPTLQAGGNTTGGHRPPGSTVDTVETLILAPAVAGTMKACAGRSGSPNGAEELDRMVAVPFDTTQITSRQNRSAPMPGDPCHPLAAGAHPPSIAFTVKDHGGDATEDVSPTLRSMGGQVAIAFQSQIARNARGQPDEICSALLAGGGGGATDRRPMAAIPTVDGWAVRKLTVRECERLQGLPDDFTAIRVRGREAADEPRYKAIGNSMAVNVMRWIGRRIDLIERAFAAAGGDHEA
ncbi:MAG: DNA cytosine methyltransferase, partial [Porphyrobacter sp.]|nr:DNA cytosine methyltransferase [Porphyrobacter sp.]